MDVGDGKEGEQPRHGSGIAGIRRQLGALHIVQSGSRLPTAITVLAIQCDSVGVDLGGFRIDGYGLDLLLGRGVDGASDGPGFRLLRRIIVLTSSQGKSEHQRAEQAEVAERIAIHRSFH